MLELNKTVLVIWGCYKISVIEHLKVWEQLIYGTSFWLAERLKMKAYFTQI